LAAEVAAMVNATEPDPGDATVAELKAAVTPVGKPVTVNVTADLRELATVVMVVWEVLPKSTVRVPGESPTERVGVADALVQLLTRTFASTDPRPDARS
jgi:hypothetical protein